MVLDKYVEFNLNGKTHKMCYPVKYVFEAERHLSDGNLMVLVSKAANRRSMICSFSSNTH